MRINEIAGKILGDRELFHKIAILFSKCLPAKIYLRFIYKAYCGKSLNLSNPITYNEKLQWYKLYYHDSLMTKCADKFKVHEYVEQCGLKHILTPQYAIFESADEIAFEELPNECFLKCNHNSAGNFHWRKKTDMRRKEKVRQRFFKMLKINQYDLSKEWAYKDIEPRIICEQFLKSDSFDDFIDFNFFCFYGKPMFVMYNKGLCDEEGNHSEGKRVVLTTDFKPLGMITSVEVLGEDEYVKPENFEDMLNYATILSKPFPHVRVDLFHVNGKIHFGELTFYSGSGFGSFYPEDWQRKIGDWFVLPDKKL